MFGRHARANFFESSQQQKIMLKETKSFCQVLTYLALELIAIKSTVKLMVAEKVAPEHLFDDLCVDLPLINRV